MLVRYSPFGEWVNVYYQPDKTSEAKLLDRIRNNGCRNSRLIRNTQNNSTMNPYVAPGDTVQLRLKVASESTVSVNGMPKGWALEKPIGKLAAGTHYLNIRTPKKTSHGAYSVEVNVNEKTSIKYGVTVVKLVP